MNLASTVVGPAAGHDPDHIALRLDEIALNYAALDGASAHLAGLLAERGIVRGDRVGIMLPNVPHFPVCYYGALRRGAVVVPMNVLLKRREVAYYLSDSGASCCSPGRGSPRRPGPAPRRPARSASWSRRSGSSRWSAPRARSRRSPPSARGHGGTALHERHHRPAQGRRAHPREPHQQRHASRSLFTKGADAICLGALPLFHSFGQTCGMNATLGGGGTLTLVPRFDAAKALEVIQRDRVNVFLGVPTMYGAMLHLPERGATTLAGAVRLGRLGDAGRADAHVRGRVRMQDPRGLRSVGELAGRVVQPSRSRAQARIDRHPDRGHGDEVVDDEGETARRRGRRDHRSRGRT